MAKTGVELIAAERDRQINQEEWTPEHDDGHEDGELALVAALYATPASLFSVQSFAGGVAYSDPWPD